MKNIKFSRLFAAFAFVACLALTACQQQPEETKNSIKGTWETSYGEKYVITSTNYDNYYKSGNDFVLSYSTNNINIVEGANNTGFVYGQFNDAAHIGYGATVGQWYALYYTDLTDKSVKLYQPYKSGGKGGCNSLEEAKTEYTLANGYFNLSNPSVGVRK